ncbi:hypothetical protein [Neisseria subflava]
MRGLCYMNGVGRALMPDKARSQANSGINARPTKTVFRQALPI